METKTKPRCRECGNVFFHRVDCLYWVKSYDEATPVTDDQRTHPAVKRRTMLVQDYHRESQEKVDGIAGAAVHQVAGEPQIDKDDHFTRSRVGPLCVCDHREHKDTGECLTCGLFCGPVSNAVGQSDLRAWRGDFDDPPPAQHVAADPDEMIPVYWFGNDGNGGPCEISIDALLENDVREALEAYADPDFGRGNPIKLTITTGMMRRSDYDALPEFEGY